jgi:hypothetical protein
MNKLSATLLFASFTGFSINMHCVEDPKPGVLLNTGATVDAQDFDFYSPIIAEICKEETAQKPLCSILLAMAKGAAVKLDDDDLEALGRTGLLNDKDQLNPGVAPLAQASLKEKEPQGTYEALCAWIWGKQLEYCDPVRKPAGTQGAGKPCG